ncbi:MAG: DUF192 domain-containing protein [Anaerolineae bacterium]
MGQGRSADRPWTRIRGLIGSSPLRTGEGLWISPCNGIHMLFMSYPIDAIYLDRAGRVVAIEPNVQPWWLGRFYREARSVLELPVGTIASTSTALGDEIVVTEDSV